MKKVVVIIQARMGSTRLPGKVLAPIAGRPMISYQIERLQKCRRVDQIVIATTTAAQDDAIVAYCSAVGMACIRGSELDVLSRYAVAARAFAATIVVRLTSDCPLIEATLVDYAIDEFTRFDTWDYLSNMIQPTWPYGMAVEVMSRRALDEADAEAKDAAEREHVTPYIYWRPERFRVKSITMQPNLSAHRWTVDTPEDLELVSRILETLTPGSPDFTLDDVLKLLGQRPDWQAINQHIVQKSVTPARKEA